MSTANFYEKGPKKRGRAPRAFTRQPALCQYWMSHDTKILNLTHHSAHNMINDTVFSFNYCTEKIMFPSPSPSLCSILTSFGAEERCAGEKGRGGIGETASQSRLDRVHPSVGRMRDPRRVWRPMKFLSESWSLGKISFPFFSHAFLRVGLKILLWWGVEIRYSINDIHKMVLENGPLSK